MFSCVRFWYQPFDVPRAYQTAVLSGEIQLQDRKLGVVEASFASPFSV